MSEQFPTPSPAADGPSGSGRFGRAQSPAVMEPAGAVACVAAGRIGTSPPSCSRRRGVLQPVRGPVPRGRLRDTGAAEERSGRNSWPPLFTALMRAELEDLQVYLEYGTPGGGRRLDALLIGATPDEASPYERALAPVCPAAPQPTG